jgi:hypothetical protein
LRKSLAFSHHFAVNSQLIDQQVTVNSSRQSMQDHHVIQIDHESQTSSPFFIIKIIGTTSVPFYFSVPGANEDIFNRRTK